MFCNLGPLSFDTSEKQFPIRPESPCHVGLRRSGRRSRLGLRKFRGLPDGRVQIVVAVDEFPGHLGGSAYGSDRDVFAVVCEICNGLEDLSLLPLGLFRTVASKGIDGLFSGHRCPPL